MTTRIQLRTKVMVFSMIVTLTFATPFVVNSNAMRIGNRENQEWTPNGDKIGGNLVFLPLVQSPEPTWKAMGFGIPDACQDMDVSPDSSLRLFLSTESGVYRSSDQGVSWELVRRGFMPKVVIDPIHPNIVYSGPMGENGYGLYKSMDGGDTWNLYNEGMTCDNFSGLSISAVNPEILFTGSY